MIHHKKFISHLVVFLLLIIRMSLQTEKPTKPPTDSDDPSISSQQAVLMIACIVLLGFFVVGIGVFSIINCLTLRRLKKRVDRMGPPSRTELTAQTVTEHKKTFTPLDPSAAIKTKPTQKTAVTKKDKDKMTKTGMKSSELPPQKIPEQQMETALSAPERGKQIKPGKRSAESMA